MRGDAGAGLSAVADVRPALIGHLKDLHLPTVRECYEETAREVLNVAPSSSTRSTNTNGWGFEE